MKELFFILGILITYYTAQAQQKAPWTLEDCIQYALENNITVKKSKLDINTAQVNYQQQQYNRLPTVMGNASGSFSNGSTIDPITSDFVSRSITSNNFGVNGQVVLYQGNQLNLQIEKNKILLKQSELYLQASENNIMLSVLEYYLQSLYYYEGIVIAENLVLSSQEELKQAKLKFENGAIAKLELADIETQHSNNQYNVVTAQNLYAQQVLALKQLLELDPSVDFEVEKVTLNEIAMIYPDKNEAFNKAVEFLPDLKIYDLQAGILNKNIQLAKAGALPSVSLNGGLNTGYTNTMNYEYWRQIRSNFSQQIGLSVSVPIFSKFQNNTNVKLAKIQLKQNELDKIAAAKTLYAKIETVYQNANANIAGQNAAKISRNNSKLAYELAKKKYEFGGLTSTELAVSRNTYLNAEQNYVQSKYLAALYQNLLKFYLGTSLTVNN